MGKFRRRTKICKECKQRKKLKDFHKDENAKDKRNPRCKTCTKKEEIYVIFRKNFYYYESLEKRCSTEMYTGKGENAAKRISEHFYTKNPILDIDKAIKKHGRDAFGSMILPTYPNERNINHDERRYIKIFNTFNDGYNNTPGNNRTANEKFTHIVRYSDDEIPVSTKHTGKHADPELDYTHKVVFIIYIPNKESYSYNTSLTYVDSVSCNFKARLRFLLYDNNSPLKEIIEEYGISALRVLILQYCEMKENLLISKVNHIESCDSINNGLNCPQDVLNIDGNNNEIIDIDDDGLITYSDSCGKSKKMISTYPYFDENYLPQQ